MSFSNEKISSLTATDLRSAAELTAKAFDRPNDSHNLKDTISHLIGAEYRTAMYDKEKLVAFATFRDLLWQ